VSAAFVLALAFNMTNLCRGMGRGIAQRKKRALQNRKLAAFVREDDPGCALPGMEEPRPVTSITQISKLNGGFKDSSFGDNKSRPIHRWIPWIAGFSSEFVRDVFLQYLPTRSPVAPMVLDPFCGIGPCARR
jgi:hypothetical protein